MKLRELLLQHNRPGTQLTATSVTVHNTANPDTTAAQNRDYFSNHENARASTHYVVDDVEVIRCIPETEVSWHAGSVANNSSISLEVCEFTDARRQQLTNQNAAELIADILIRYKWTKEQIKTHRDWSGKYCPRKLLPIWDQFLGLVDRYLRASDSDDPLAKAVKVLQAQGVINSPDYWLQAARPGQMARGEYVYLLLVNMAQHLTDWR